MKFTLNPDRFVKEFMGRVSAKQNIASKWLLDVIKTLTPEDTWTMVNSYKVVPSITEWFIVTTGITNSANNKGFLYPHIVDKGAGKIYSYQKPKWSRWWYIGDLTDLFARSIAAYKDKFLQIISS